MIAARAAGRWSRAEPGPSVAALDRRCRGAELRGGSCGAFHEQAALALRRRELRGPLQDLGGLGVPAGPREHVAVHRSQQVIAGEAGIRTHGLDRREPCLRAVGVQHGDRSVELHMYVDSLASIASGREISAFPKKFGAPALYVDTDTLVGTLDYGSLRVATATMGYKHLPLDEAAARAEIGQPTFGLKILPGYDRRPRILELVRSQITDITIKGAWSGPARLQLFEHAMAPLADLPVHEVLAASHILTDLTLGRARVVFDYLNE